MLLTVSVCFMFCITEAPDVQYSSLQRCLEQGAIISGMIGTKLPRLPQLDQAPSVTVSCASPEGWALEYSL